MKIKRDQVTGLVLVLLGIVLMAMISQFKKPITAEYPGPKLMPGIAALGLIICGAGIFVKGCRQKEADAMVISKKGLVRMLITFAALWLYILGLQFVGFLIATPFLVFGLTAMAVQAAAQYYNPKFGKVSAEEVSMATCAMDPEADAMYLYDIGDVYYSNNGMMIYDVQVRIKIFKKEAVGLADVEYPYYTNTSPSEEVSRIDACTYNMVDGKVVKTQMSKKNIFKEKVSDRLSRVKFSLPDVREGSVIEYKFSLSNTTTPSCTRR